MADSVIRARIDPGLKKAAAAVFKSMGLTTSEAVRLFLLQSVAERALPFALKEPNAETRSAIAEARRGEGKEYTDLGEMWAELEAEAGKPENPACVR
jgi:DNA-damage-inducible protein J